MLLILKKTASIFVFLVFIITLLYIGNGPGAVPVANGVSTSPQTQSFSVSLAVMSEITITAPSNVTMTPAIYGITGNLGAPASGSTSFTVKTNNATGFNLTVHSSTNPALSTGSYYFNDYTTLGAVPDFSWQSPAASSATFGFSVGASGVNGSDAVLDFIAMSGLGLCGVMPGDPNDTEHCFRGFEGTTPITIVNRSTNTGSAGVTETLAFRAESNAAFLVQDTYAATITVTAATN